MSVSEDIASKLLQIKAIQISPQNPFTWASGLKSPVYCDNRLLLSYPGFRRDVTEAFRDASARFMPFDKIAGVATAGIAHGVLLAAEMDCPFAYVRSSPKGHGKQNQIEGLVRPQDRILVIEDLISTGGSCLRAVEALRSTGAHVSGVMAIFQYGFPEVADHFHAHNVPFMTLCNYQTVLKVATDQQYITPAERTILDSWHQDPKTWAAQYAPA